MTKAHTSEEIKNRLSNIGEAIGTIALEYIVELEKENEQLKSINKKMECCKNCKKYKMLESQMTLRCLKNQITNFHCDEWELAE